MKKRLIWKSLTLFLVFMFLLTGIASAETKTVSGITGRTYTDGSQAKANTSATVGQYSMTVTERIWGGSPNPLKDEKSRSCQNCTSTGTVSICWQCYFGYESTKHVARIQIGADPVTLYTSRLGCHSSSCWYFNTGGCSSTCPTPPP